jgi:hypothetical protein
MNAEQAQKLVQELKDAIAAAEFARAVSPLGVSAQMTGRVVRAETAMIRALTQELVS